MHFLFLSVFASLAGCLVVNPSVILLPLYSRKNPAFFFDLESRMKWAAYTVSEHHIRTLLPLFLEVYMKWSSMLHSCSEKTGLCWSVRERKPSLLSVRRSELGVPKWAGKQWLSCHAVNQKYQWFPMNLPAEAEFQTLSQFWRDSGLRNPACIYAGRLCKRVDIHRKTSTCLIGETKEKKKHMEKGLESEQLF